MKTSKQIAASLIARRDEYDAMMAAKRARAYRALALGGGAAAACLIGFAVISSALKTMDREQLVVNYTPAPMTNAPETVPPSDAPETPLPTASITDAHDPTPLPTQEAERFVYVSDHEKYSQTAHRLIGGDTLGSGTAFMHDKGGVFFGFEDDALVAYAVAIGDTYSADTGYELSDPIEYFPKELGIRARKSVSDNIRRYKQPDFADDENLQLYGFMGEGYIIFTDEPFHGYQASAIFALDENGVWTELASNADCQQQLTGGCITPGGVGLLCYFDREGMRLDDYSPRKLLVYRTENYGETWEKLDIVLPEQYEGIAAPPSCALTPVFDGEHGVMMASFVSFEGDGLLNAVTHTVWFESTDGGTIWRFMGVVGEGSPA